jgi:uncharacterized protein (TIGR03437 family)
MLDLFAVVFDANSDAYILKLATSPAPAPVITGMGNAASYDTVGFAEGSFITIFGSNFGTMGQAPVPYPTGLEDVSGVDIRPISGAAAVPALLYFTSSGQINAILPSQVPLGDANVTG